MRVQRERARRLLTVGTVEGGDGSDHSAAFGKLVHGTDAAGTPGTASYGRAVEISVRVYRDAADGIGSVRPVNNASGVIVLLPFASSHTVPRFAPPPAYVVP